MMTRTYKISTGRMLMRSLLLLFFTASLISGLLHAADKPAGIDAILIMDSSGSMAKNDPLKLRVPAGKMFMSLLGKDDRVGLISFSDNGYPVLRLTTPTARTNKKILASVDKISSRGVYTNLHDAIAKGIAMHGKQEKPDREKILVLMSDGKMDVGNPEKDDRLTLQIHENLIEKLKEKKIKVYTVAFTEASDVDLMKTLSDKTGGLFRMAQSHKDLHTVFSSIFEQSKSPDMLPIDGGEFTVDESIEEVTLIASKERSDVRIFLLDPDGKKIGSDSRKKNFKWFQSHHFDMITISRPKPGTWKLLSTAGNNHAYIVTNMSLENDVNDTSLDINEDIVVSSWLEEDGEILNREAVLSNTEFYIRIEDPEGAEAAFDLFDDSQYGDKKMSDGKYANTLSFETPGPYRIHFIAKSETFQREKTIILEVESPAGEKAVSEPVPEMTKPAAVITDVVKKPIAPEKESGIQPEVEKETEADTAKIPEETKINLPLVAGVFVGINLLLGLIGGGIWWFLKRKKKAKEGDEEESEDKAEAEK
ncbi:MAG: vWA domain-containing protein [Gammaproteobacteria bacterium]